MPKATLTYPVILKAAVRRYLEALDRISELNDRDTKAKNYSQWLAADCAYTEALENLRAVFRGLTECQKQP